MRRRRLGGAAGKRAGWTPSFVDGGFTESTVAETAFRAADVKARGDVLVAVDRPGDLLGMAIAVPPGSPARRFAGIGDAELHLLCVRPDGRNRGVGSALIEAVVRAVRASGASRVILWTQPSMEAAQRLYLRHGFRRMPAMDFSRGSRTFLVFVREAGVPT